MRQDFGLGQLLMKFLTDFIAIALSQKRTAQTKKEILLFIIKITLGPNFSIKCQIEEKNLVDECRKISLSNFDQNIKVCN